MATALYRISTLDYANQNGNDRQHQQDVNEPSQRVRTDHSEQPQNQQDHSDGPEHLCPLSQAELACDFARVGSGEKCSYQENYLRPLSSSFMQDLDTR